MLDVSAGETVHAEFYGDGYAMFNGDISFECRPELEPEIAVQPPAPAPPPEPTPATIDMDQLKHLFLGRLQVVPHRLSFNLSWEGR